MPATLPSIAVITVVHNAAATVERAVDSVLSQADVDVEYVVVDGGSTDGTLEVLRSLTDRFAKIISEPDDGIADAFNKGVAATRAPLVTFVNADDWLEPGQLARAAATLTGAGVDFVFGDLLFHDAAGNAVFRMTGDADYAASLHRRMPQINHPTLVSRRRVYEAVGGFDPRYRAAMDYDWLRRVHAAGFVGRHDPAIVGHQTLGGVADRDYRRTLREVKDIARRHGQSWIGAESAYLARLTRSVTRRGLEHVLPVPVVARMRRLINPECRPADA